MARHAQPYSFHQRKDSGYWFFKLAAWTAYKPTGTKIKSKALEVIQDAITEERKRHGPQVSLRVYAEPFYRWESCPHVRRLQEDGRSITRRHVRGQRALLDQKILADPIADMPIQEIRRATVLDFRTRLMARHSAQVVNHTIGVLKVIFKEGIFREELERDPTLGVGLVKGEKRQVGTFTAEELQALFPPEAPGPWKGRLDYTCFMIAATTGMRRGEIYALRWCNVDLPNAVIRVREAWKGGEEVGLPKNGKERRAPLPQQTVTALEELREEAVRIGPQDLVICNDDGRRQDGVWWKRHFAYAMEALKIDARARGLRPHSFRHTLNSILRGQGMDAAKIRAMLGWSSEAVQDGYTKWQLEDLRAGAKRIEEILNPPGA
jgi:integrase